MAQPRSPQARNWNYLPFRWGSFRGVASGLPPDFGSNAEGNVNTVREIMQTEVVSVDVDTPVVEVNPV